ncbi:MAG: diadenylate cyclase CdaA [Bacteroidetes bacterium]|nr:diadenylate cyclase CdaA [Bacteroidota bacterium]MDA0889230.1 diadenylate cyclase CdaA [Bacteroidota bacterium]MDA1085142.1 diadenylate cyclase CdaA [Bacteroidota bacterium]
MFDFLDFNLLDVLDIILVALLLYYAYRLVRGTAAISIFVGIVILYLIWKITDALNMELLSNILGGFMSVGVFALIVVFQQEIRKLLLMLGSSNLANRKTLNRYLKIFTANQNSIEPELNIEALIQSCASMKKQKTGALLVLERNNSLEFLKPSGVIVNMEVSVPVIESIFHKNAPLHDGAAIIENNTITATRVVLPVSENKSIPKRYGLRHRAAVGITEKTDALVLVVSEETGAISYFKNGERISFSSYKELGDMLSKDMD